MNRQKPLTTAPAKPGAWADSPAADDLRRAADGHTHGDRGSPPLTAAAPKPVPTPSIAGRARFPARLLAFESTTACSHPSPGTGSVLSALNPRARDAVPRFLPLLCFQGDSGIVSSFLVSFVSPPSALAAKPGKCRGCRVAALKATNCRPGCRPARPTFPLSPFDLRP